MMPEKLLPIQTICVEDNRTPFGFIFPIADASQLQLQPLLPTMMDAMTILLQNLIWIAKQDIMSYRYIIALVSKYLVLPTPIRDGLEHIGESRQIRVCIFIWQRLSIGMAME